MKTKLLSLLFSILLVSAAHAEKPTLPAVPEALKPLKASITMRRDVGLTLSLQSDTPLTEEQWDWFVA